MAGDVTEIVASKQSLSPFAGRPVACTMKSVTAHAVLLAPFVGHRVGSRGFVHLTIRAGLNHRDQWNAGKLLTERANGCNVRGIMGGREE